MQNILKSYLYKYFVIYYFLFLKFLKPNNGFIALMIFYIYLDLFKKSVLNLLYIILNPIKISSEDNGINNYFIF